MPTIVRRGGLHSLPSHLPSIRLRGKDGCKGIHRRSTADDEGGAVKAFLPVLFSFLVPLSEQRPVLSGEWG